MVAGNEAGAGRTERRAEGCLLSGSCEAADAGFAVTLGKIWTLLPWPERGLGGKRAPFWSTRLTKECKRHRSKGVLVFGESGLASR